MKTKNRPQESASTLVVTIAVVGTILALLGSAVAYTQHVSRISDRSRKSAQAVEIADGHLEYLFSSWRNIYRTPYFRYSYLPTNYFRTTLYPVATPTPGPAGWPGVPPAIPTPPPTAFPVAPGYTVDTYRIEAVTPMVELDSTGKSTLAVNAPPPAAYGPNSWQFSFFYLASVDVSVPVMNGTVQAKVRRVFEKKFDNPWTYAVFFHDDLEIHPSSPMTITGPIHTNSNLYIGTSNFTTESKAAYSGEYVNGKSPTDPTGRTITTPNFPTDLPPSQESAYLPFGWNLKLTNADGSVNNDSYHELIERPVVEGTSDPLNDIRFYSQAGVKVLVAQNNTLTIMNGTTVVTASSSGDNKKVYDAVVAAVTTNRAMYDNREGEYVRLTNFNVGTFISTLGSASFNGVLYISDTTPDGTSVTSQITGTTTSVSTTLRGIRLINGGVHPTNGLTVASENPVYIQGDYNVGTSSPPSNTGTFTSPTYGTYVRKRSAVISDAINVLSSAWTDAGSTVSFQSGGRVANSTTINAALVSGTSDNTAGGYSGGLENFLRLQEDWRNKNLTYYGSMVQLYKSTQAPSVLTAGGQVLKSPQNSKWFYDKNFMNGAPPGNLQISAFLQQQRWYQVY